MTRSRSVLLVLAAGSLAACSCSDDRSAACVISAEGAFFGAVAVGQTAQRSIEITNQCRRPMTMRSAEIVEIEGVEFTIVEPMAFPVEIAPQTTRDLVVRARPLAYDTFITEILVDGIGVADDRPRRFMLEVDALCRPDGGTPDRVDTDLDGVPDGCDVCASGDDRVDTDGDTVPDGCDVCADRDDLADGDGDNVPDGAGPDVDGDGRPDLCDVCVDVADDGTDTDGDGFGDACDACPAFDDAIDADGDSVPDGCDFCPGFDDRIDEDGNGLPDACDCEPYSETELESFVAGAGVLVYALSRVPKLDTIVVRAEGEPAEGWVFDRSQNAVAFDTASAVDPGTVIAVEYDIDCALSIDACSDGIDNDLDGLTDYPEEPGCRTPFDPSEADPVEAPGCADGIDNDGDGDVDFPDDADCSSAAHGYEACAEQDDDAFGYRWCRESFTSSPCPDLSAGAPLTLAAGSASVPLGFTLDVYGRSFTDVEVRADGVLAFEVPQSPSVGQCLPVDGLDRALYAWGEDLDETAGNVWARASGDTPARRLDVQWRLPPVGGSDIDVRAVIEESGDITVCYVDSVGGAGSDDGASATAGLQGNGSIFLEASCDAPGLTQGQLIRYLHP